MVNDIEPRDRGNLPYETRPGVIGLYTRSIMYGGVCGVAGLLLIGAADALIPGPPLYQNNPAALLAEIGVGLLIAGWQSIRYYNSHR